MKFSKSSNFTEVSLIINSVDSIFNMSTYLNRIGNFELFDSWIFLLKIFISLCKLIIVNLEFVYFFNQLVLCFGCLFFKFQFSCSLSRYDFRSQSLRCLRFGLNYFIFESRWLDNWVVINDWLIIVIFRYILITI